MPALNEVLRQLFQEHGVESVLQDDWVIFPGRKFRAHATITQEIPHDGAISLQLDVRLESTAGRVLLESFAGIGADWQEAVADALRTFTFNVLHVLLVAFFGFKAENDTQVTQQHWQHEGRAHRITLGPIAARGELPAEASSPLNALIERIKTEPLLPGTHWIRLYYAHNAGETVVCEAVLNNEVWPQIHEKMSATTWLDNREFYSLRVFFVLQIQKGGEVSPQTAVSWLAQILAARETFDEDEICAQLRQYGVSPALAERAFRFTQVAWVRPLLSQAIQARFAPDYKCFDLSDNLVESGQLAHEPCFVAATELAPFYMETAGFRWITLCSAEMQTVNNALNQGVAMSEMEGAQISAPQFYLQYAAPR